MNTVPAKSFVQRRLRFKHLIRGQIMKSLFVVLSLILGAHTASARPGPVPSSSPSLSEINDVELEAPELKDIAEGYCSDPSMTFKQRSAIISRSIEDAIACMGEKWVMDGIKPSNVSIGAMSIDADVSASRMTVLDPAGQTHLYPISPGRSGHATHTGHYTSFLRLEPASYVVQSTDVDYTGAPMPYAMFYYAGYAIHGTYAVGQLGRPASHGCVRVSVAGARQIQTWVRSVGNHLDISIHGVAVQPVAPKRRKLESNPYEVQPQIDPYQQQNPYMRMPRAEPTPYFGQPQPQPAPAPSYRQQPPGASYPPGFAPPVPNYRRNPQPNVAPNSRVKPGQPTQLVPPPRPPAGLFEDDDNN
jgi:lipoprotein-anchoring transpeptidase ErfK/SrfK